MDKLKQRIEIINQLRENINKAINKAKFRSADLIENVGLSYRVINDWTEKGILRDLRKGEKDWREFTSEDFVISMICKELRDKFGVPLESLRFIREQISRNRDNPFPYAFQLHQYGIPISIVTNLEDFLIIDTDMDIGDLIKHGYIRNISDGHLIVLSISNIFNKILSLHNLPLPKVSNVAYDSYYHEKGIENESGIITSKEREIIGLIRDKSFKRITVHLEDGNIIQVDTEEELSEAINQDRKEDLINIIDSHAFQSITIQKQDNKILRINRKVPRKLKNNRRINVDKSV